MKLLLRKTSIEMICSKYYLVRHKLNLKKFPPNTFHLGKQSHYNSMFFPSFGAQDIRKRAGSKDRLA